MSNDAPVTPVAEGTPAPAAAAASAPDLVAELKALDTAPPEHADPAATSAQPKPEDAEAAAARDPDIAQRLEVLNRARKRNDAQIAEGRAALEKERAEVSASKAAVEAYQTAAKRAKVDPVGYLASLGVEPSVELARAIFAATDNAPAAMKEQAAGGKRQRDVESKIEELDRRFQEREKRLEERESQMAQQQAWTEYRGKLTSVVDDTTPLIKTGLSKNAERVYTALHATASRLMQASGEVPEPAAVLKEYERILRDDLAIFTGTAPTKTQAPSAGETKAAKTLGNDLNSPTRSKSTPANRREAEQDVLARLKSGDLDD